jgi:hypothetical protein
VPKGLFGPAKAITMDKIEIACCPRCSRWGQWTDGTDSEYWCQACGAESDVIGRTGGTLHDTAGRPIFVLELVEKTTPPPA